MRCFAMLSDALKSADLTDLRWMRCGCADACAQFDGVREARDAFAMLSHPKTDLSCDYSARQIERAISVVVVLFCLR